MQLEAPQESTTKVANLAEAAALITGLQIRMARAALRWSAQQLADKCGFSYATIQRAESVDDMPAMTAKNLVMIRKVLEEAGIEFSDRGVRLK
jgi:transcriptional regulator with XRE-family HTH domain